MPRNYLKFYRIVLAQNQSISKRITEPLFESFDARSIKSSVTPEE